MVSEIDICNRALSANATRSTISSFNDGSNESNVCSLFYTFVRDALLRSVHWDFCRAQTAPTLSQLKSTYDTNSTCPVPWGYEYAYPSDCVKMRYILPFLNTAYVPNQSPPLTTGGGNPIQGIAAWDRPIKFLVATDKDQNGADYKCILTNQPQAIGVYTRKITNPDLFDEQFTAALVAALAVYISPGTALNFDLMKYNKASADGIIAQARVTNGNEGPMNQDRTPDWLRVRETFGTFQYGYDYIGWDAMPWPSGL